MNRSKAAIVVNTIAGKICSIIGYSLGAFFILGLFIEIFSTMDASSKASSIILCILFIALSAFLVFKGFKIKKLIQRFKTYIKIISTDHVTSLDTIASSTSQSVDFVRNDIQKMINKKFFANAYIDKTANEIIIVGSKDQAQNTAVSQDTQQNTNVETENVKCPGCGAMNLKQKGVTVYCEYCGTPLK